MGWHPVADEPADTESETTMRDDRRKSRETTLLRKGQRISKYQPTTLDALGVIA